MPHEHIPNVGDLSFLLPAIRAAHRKRCAVMEMRKRVDLQLGSYLRSQLGWRLDLPKKQQESIKKQAEAIIRHGERVIAGKASASEGPDEFSQFSDFVLATIRSREPLDLVEAQAKKAMEQLAEQLPVWSAFGAGVRGFGRGSLAVIVGEAGDLSNYSSDAKLFKRMGVAVMGDIRQGGLTRGAATEEWIAHGYNKKRRSKLWNIGDALIKGNKDGVYRSWYLSRKQYELDRDPTMKPIKAHRRAQRYMEKRLLRHLWRAWRRTMSEAPMGPV